jgi:tyrosyl-tRNA synthetase
VSDAILADLAARSLVHQSTDEERIRARLRNAPARLYCGFDPTAPSLQVGNLVPLLGLARFQAAGHAPIVLLGGGTGLIGDPRATGERTLADADTVRTWAERIRPQLERFLDFDPGRANAAVLVDNHEWLAPLTAMDLLRDVGKHFPVGLMLAKETVRRRLEDGISYTEFSYMLLQAYDYLVLSRRFGCRLQIGGSDQWGNITAGCELIRRVDGGEADAITLPLVTKADGEKFGKSESGAVYLDPELTSPYAFYQFWVNQDDADTARFLRTFSLRPLDELTALETAISERPQAREAQRALASELVTLVHGERARARAVATSEALFGQASLASADPADLEVALGDAPTVRIDAAGEQPSVAELFVRAASRPEAVSTSTTSRSPTFARHRPPIASSAGACSCCAAASGRWRLSFAGRDGSGLRAGRPVLTFRLGSESLGAFGVPRAFGLELAPFRMSVHGLLRGADGGRLFVRVKARVRSLKTEQRGAIGGNPSRRWQSAEFYAERRSFGSGDSKAAAARCRRLFGGIGCGRRSDRTSMASNLLRQDANGLSRRV